MSLLIDALKKHRSTSTPSVAQVSSDETRNVSSSKTKKIILISLITVIVIALTATTSFLIFKHIEKKRMAQALGGKVEQIQKVKELLAGKSGLGQAEQPSGSTGGSSELREKLQQRMQQRGQGQASSASDAALASPSAADSSSTDDASSADDASSTDDSAAPATNPQPLRGRLAAHKAGDVPMHNRNQMNNEENSAPSDSDNASSDDTTSNDASSDDTSSDDASSDNSEADNDNSSDSNNDAKVDIKVVSDQLGANNPIYQKALGYMQLNQYDKALPLLENNDDLVLKTQGLSALLLARIYLATAEYELADQVLDRALLLRAGSEVDLLSLRAQALFMQRKYQETIDILASQSPNLSTSPGYYALLADAYMHLDQASNAVSVFQQIVAQFPNSPDYWLGLAVACQKMGDAGSAIVAYRRAAQLSQNDPQVTLFINQQLQALQAV